MHQVDNNGPSIVNGLSVSTVVNQKDKSVSKINNKVLVAVEKAFKEVVEFFKQVALLLTWPVRVPINAIIRHFKKTEIETAKEPKIVDKANVEITKVDNKEVVATTVVTKKSLWTAKTVALAVGATLVFGLLVWNRAPLQAAASTCNALGLKSCATRGATKVWAVAAPWIPFVGSYLQGAQQKPQQNVQRKLTPPGMSPAMQRPGGEYKPFVPTGVPSGIPPRTRPSVGPMPPAMPTWKRFMVGLYDQFRSKRTPPVGISPSWKGTYSGH